MSLLLNLEQMMKSKLCYTLIAFLALGGGNVHAYQAETQTVSSNPTAIAVKHLTPQQAHQAILKMAGEYRVSFRFEEVYATKPQYELKEPDISKASETVIVLENSANKISLQHLLVMKNTVVKHWRQDWEYEPTSMWHYIGNYQWKKVALTPAESKGKWLQTVWQVDDSPRYASLGEWTSDHGIEAWTSQNTYRPLPRRELTTRDDYDTLSGFNRQAITANGWVHEQNNIKFDAKTQTPIARELGFNQYIRVEKNQIDFSPAYDYWEKNKNYWETVRHAWDQALEQNEIVGLRFTRQKDDDKSAHYVYFMDQAKAFSAKKAPTQLMQSEVKKLLNQELVAGSIK
jgi:hypothetical protein